MKQLEYHYGPGLSTMLDVVERHEDGKVDLARDGKIIVSRCPITATPEIGAATEAAIEAEVVAPEPEPEPIEETSSPKRGRPRKSND